jgi:predicted MPP superfamily phosphohydrolase
MLLIVVAAVSSVLLLNVSATASTSSSSSSSSSSSTLQKLSSDLTSIYFIGDIHGDVGCAKEWVKKTNLINITSSPYTWVGNNQSNEAIVFMGDYVDKGSTSSSALLFVKELQTTFPDNIVTILGNHDFFLMMDTALQYNDNDNNDVESDSENKNKKNPHPLGHPHHDYTYAFMHPEEYIESNFTKNRDDDEEILEYILSGLSYVYDHNLVNTLHMCAPNCIGIGDNDAVNNMFDIIPPFNTNHTLKERVLERLQTWRNEYAYGLYDSNILQWMTQQPIVAVVGDALIVHGGVSAKIITYLDSLQTRITLEDFIQEVVNNRLNAFFMKQFEEQNDIDGPNQIESHLFSESDIPFELVLDFIQHRGYFHESNGCKDVNTVLDTLSASDDADRSINRVVVGHTPQQYATELCDGKLLATDSSLSRSFRTYGNMYCPLNLTSSTSSSSSSPTYCGDTMKEACEGSISLLTRTSINEKWPKNIQQYQFHELPIIINSHENDVQQSNDEL